MNEDLIATQLLQIQNALGGLDAKVDHLTEEVGRIHRYEKRLGRVESDLKTARRIFGGLFTFLIALGAATVNWLKG